MNVCVRMLILDENLLTYESKLTFGWLNMVGEIGGTVGLCLGWSLLSFLEMTKLDDHANNKNTVNPGCASPNIKFGTNNQAGS